MSASRGLFCAIGPAVASASPMAGRDATICAVLGAGQSGYVGSIDEDVYAELDSSSTGAQMAVLYASRYLANLAAAQTQSDRTRSLNFNQLFSTLTSASQPLEPLVELLTCRTLADAAAQMPVHCALRQLTDLCECSMSTLGQAGCGLPAACTLAISIFRSSSPAAIVADFAASLQPHCLKLLPTVPRAVSAQLVSELLPLALATITSAACPMFQVRLRTAFLELLAADKEAIRETGLTLGVRFPDELFVTPDTLCNTKEVWLLLRRCLCATSEFCRRRALFILLSAVGCTTTEVSRSSPPPTNRKKCKREKRPTEPKSGWAAFAWAYVAVETGTEAVSPNWTKVVETLGQTGTLSVPGGAVDVVPWAQLLLELGIRHCHPNVRRGALDASLTGLAFGGVHTLLVDGDLFVISCCDIMSENSVAADLFSEIRANTEASKTRSTVHAFLNRQVSASKLFLRQWVEWLICRFNAPPGSRPCSNALLHVYLHWLATIQAESLVPAGCGLTEQNLRGLAGLVKNIDATPSSSQVCVNGVQAFAVRSVVSAATRLTEPNSSIFRRLAPILLLAGPHEFEAQHSGTEWLERLSAGHAAGDLQLTVSSFLCPGQFSLDSISEGLCAEELARAAANMICILAGGETTGQRAAVSTIRMALHILERAHTHLYQPLAQLNRAVLLVDAVMTAIDSAHSEAPTSATACDTLRIYLCEWLQNEGAASAASAAIGTVLAKWAGTDFQDHDSNQNRQLQIAGEPGGKGTVVTNGTAGACFSLLAHLQKFPRGRVEPVVATLLTQLLHQCDLLSTTQSMIGLGRLELALGHLRGPCLGRLKVSTGHLCDAAIGSLLAGIDVASAMGAHLRWRCIHCLASSRCAAFGPGGAVPRELVMTLLSQASAALELATDTVKIQTIVATVGDVFTLLVDVEKLDPVPDDVNNALTTCQHKLLNACGRASASLPTDFRHLQSDLQRFTMVHTLLHPTLFGQSSIHRSVEKCLRFTLRELYTMSIENSNWAPVMALHCTRMWLRHPTSALICVPEIAKLCCYTSLRKTGVAGLQPDTKLAVHQTENELLVRATMLFFLRAVIRNTGHEQLVKRLVLTMLELVKEYYHKTPQHDLTVVHKVRISLGQSLCVLASNIQAGAPVAKTIHCVVAEKMLREYLPSERQYLDLLSLQLFRKCPALAAQWLPTVVTNCALRPQIMQGVLLVTGKWLLHLDSHCHMQYFKPLFRALVTWLHSGHRGLRSLVQVLAQRLLDDCYSRAASARQQGDIVAVAYYTALDCDEQLHCIYDYLQTATEGTEFRQRLAEELSAFDPDLLCEPQSLLGRSNFMDLDGTHGGRVFVPNGIGPESESLATAARKLTTACWLPDTVLRKLCVSMHDRSNSALTVPWGDLVIRYSRIHEYKVCPSPPLAYFRVHKLHVVVLANECYILQRNALGQNVTHKASTGNRRLVVVASLLDKRPNIAGLCRTAELIGGCELVVHDKELLDHEQSRAISQSAENSLAITEIPAPWLLEYLEDKKRHGFKIIAVEQTSSSISVETYEWPEKVLLLLGKEKEGVPAEFLRAVCGTVEIPQLGIIRSLNVHVSAAIFLAQAFLASE